MEVDNYIQVAYSKIRKVVFTTAEGGHKHVTFLKDNTYMILGNLLTFCYTEYKICVLHIHPITTVLRSKKYYHAFNILTHNSILKVELLNVRIK